jgi:D-ribose pyranose/furanose isomerase RbsD
LAVVSAQRKIVCTRELCLKIDLALHETIPEFQDVMTTLSVQEHEVVEQHSTAAKPRRRRS